MITQMILDALQSNLVDIMFFCTALFVAFFAMRSFQLMRAGVEFDRQYDAELKQNSSRFQGMTAESHDAWRSQYVNTRTMTNFQRQRLAAKDAKQKLIVRTFNATASAASSKPAKPLMPRSFKQADPLAITFQPKSTASISSGVFANIRASREAQRTARSSQAQSKSFRSYSKNPRVASAGNRKKYGNADAAAERYGNVAFREGEKAARPRKQSFIAQRAKHRGFHTDWKVRFPKANSVADAPPLSAYEGAF